MPRSHMTIQVGTTCTYHINFSFTLDTGSVFPQSSSHADYLCEVKGHRILIPSHEDIWQHQDIHRGVWNPYCWSINSNGDQRYWIWVQCTDSMCMWHVTCDMWHVIWDACWKGDVRTIRNSHGDDFKLEVHCKSCLLRRNFHDTWYNNITKTICVGTRVYVCVCVWVCGCVWVCARTLHNLTFQVTTLLGKSKTTCGTTWGTVRLLAKHLLLHVK